MDQTDIEILKCLRRNARMKASAIGEQIDLSVSAVTERIRKLENAGIISRYTVVIDQRAIGNDVVALMEVQLEHPRCYDAFSQMVQNNPAIVSCHYLTGDYDFMLKIVTNSSEHLEQIHRYIKSFNGVCNTKTYFVLKTTKDDITVLPDQPDKD